MEPKKILNSTQTLENFAPPQTPRIRKNSATAYAQMPQNKRQLVEAHASVYSFGNLTREVRMLFRKTEKAFDLLHVQNAHNEQLLAAQPARIDELEAKKRKKVAVDSNEAFVDVDAIQASLAAARSAAATPAPIKGRRRVQRAPIERQGDPRHYEIPEMAQMSSVFSQFE